MFPYFVILCYPMLRAGKTRKKQRGVDRVGRKWICSSQTSGFPLKSTYEFPWDPTNFKSNFKPNIAGEFNHINLRITIWVAVKVCINPSLLFFTQCNLKERGWDEDENKGVDSVMQSGGGAWLLSGTLPRPPQSTHQCTLTLHYNLHLHFIH